MSSAKPIPKFSEILPPPKAASNAKEKKDKNKNNCSIYKETGTGHSQWSCRFRKGHMRRVKYGSYLYFKIRIFH